MNSVKIDFDPYNMLGLKNDPDLPLSIIKKKFYQLSLKYHPDKMEIDDSFDDYQKIITSYNILRNKKLRTNYHQQFPLDHYHLKTKLRSLILRCNKNVNKSLNNPNWATSKI